MSTNIIDTLVVALRLDATEFEKGVAKVNGHLEKLAKTHESQAKQLQAQGKTMAQGFNVAKQELLSFFAVIAGSAGMKNLIEGVTGAQAKLAQKAQDFGESARTLDIWGHAMERLGGSTDGLLQSWQSLNQAMVDATQGKETPVVQAMTALGVRLTDDGKNVRSMTDMLKDLNKAMNSSAFTEQERIRLGAMLGFDPGTVNALRQSPAAFQAAYEEAAKLSRVTKESAEAAKRLRSEWALFKTELEAASNAIYNNAAPALETLLKKVNDLGKAFLELDEKNGGALSTAVAGIGMAGGALASGSLVKRFLGSKAGAAVAGPAAAGAGTEVAAAGGGLVGLLRGIAPWLTGAGLALHHEGLNKGEEDELAKRWAGVAGPEGSSSKNTPLFDRLEKANQLPAGALDRIWKIESNRGKNMVSPKGATGHFQFMPKTAAEYGLSREDTFDLEKSATAAAKYLGSLQRKFGDFDKALAAYNWGPGNLDRQGMDKMPAETAAYLRKYHGESNGTVWQAELLRVLNGVEKALGTMRDPDSKKGIVGDPSSIGGGLRIGAQANLPLTTQTSMVTNKSETHIGTLVVNSAAKDATGIASDISAELKRKDLSWILGGPSSSAF